MTDIQHQIRHNRPGRMGMPSVLRPSLLGYCALPAKFGMNETTGEKTRVHWSSNTDEKTGQFKSSDGRITTPTSFNTQWFHSALRKPQPLIRGRLGSDVYCPAAFRAPVSPINHGDESREWVTSSSIPRTSSIHSSYRVSDGKGTGFSQSVSTDLWSSGPMSRETSYRRSFSLAS